MRQNRDWYRPHEEGAKHTVLKDPVAEYYEYELAGMILAKGFGGKRSKPDFFVRFPSAERRKEYIENWLGNMRTRAKEAAERKATRNRPHSLKIGDILDTCWGYDQTNRDFYEVLEVKGKSTVVISEIGAKLDHHDGGCMDYIVPKPGSYIGKPMLKRVSSDNHIRIASYASASPWSGNPLGQTDAYSGH